MKRQIKWNKAVVERFKLVRASKCGRFKIVSKSMAKMSGRPGRFTERAYDPQRADGTRIGKYLCETLSEAYDRVELENDPNWEGDS